MNDKRPKNSLNLNVEAIANGHGQGAAATTSVSNSAQGAAGEDKLKEDNNSTATSKETYKSIPEDNLGPVTNNSESTTPPIIEVKMVQGDDGADEQMLGKKDEVKFIKGDQQNGDAKIDIGAVSKNFNGLSKEELMQYANDPFWVRIRWIFFILFWVTWAGMLILSILIILNAPKCEAPVPLKWYHKGPFAFFNSVNDLTPEDNKIVSKIHAKGVIYKLPAEETYAVKDPKVEEKIKKLVANYKASEVHVILDITPNYVTKDSPMLADAKENEAKRSAFIWKEMAEVPNNWLSTVNGSAWDQIIPGNWVLSQFGTGLYDLNMNDTWVKKELKSSLQHLLKLGVQGIRLNNSKYYLINPTVFENEEESGKTHLIHTEYGFWTHSHTTFQAGLGELMYEFMVAVKNVSMDAFLSVSEDTIQPQAYRTTTGEFGIELPMYGRFPHVLNEFKAKELEMELNNIFDTVGNSTWLQWNYELTGKLNPSAYALFMSLLAGVPVIPASSPIVNISENILETIEQSRESSSYMHGDFDLYVSGDVIAYSRLKSGNPGYFVAFNPSLETATVDFSGAGLPEKMTIDLFSDNFNVTGVESGGRIYSKSIVLSPQSTAIYTYVPVKKE